MSCLQNILHPIFPRASELRLNLFQIKLISLMWLMQVSHALISTESQTLFFTVTGKEGVRLLTVLFVLIYTILFISGRVCSKRPFFRTCLIKGSNLSTEWDMISSPNRPSIYGYTALLWSTRPYQTRLDNSKTPLYRAAW